MIEISEQKNARFHEDSLTILALHFVEALEHGHLANADAFTDRALCSYNRPFRK